MSLGANNLTSLPGMLTNSQAMSSSMDYASSLVSSPTLSPRTGLTMDNSPKTATTATYDRFWDMARKSSEMTTKCYLDGRYFNTVLSRYPGTVESSMMIKIDEGALTSDPNDGDLREFVINLAFDTNWLKATSGDLRLIKVIIETAMTGSNDVSRHTNLIWIEKSKKKIHRFEPIDGHPYMGPIHDAMGEYFADILPGFTFMTSDEHPQMLKSASCPNKGLCAAFVLHKALRLITGEGKPPPSDPIMAEKQAMQFAAAIERVFGTLPGEPERDYGFFNNFRYNRYNPRNWSNRGRGAALGGVAGAAIGGLLSRSWGGALLGGGLGLGAGYLWGNSRDRRRNRRRWRGRSQYGGYGNRGRGFLGLF